MKLFGNNGPSNVEDKGEVKVCLLFYNSTQQSKNDFIGGSIFFDDPIDTNNSMAAKIPDLFNNNTVQQPEKPEQQPAEKPE